MSSAAMAVEASYPGLQGIIDAADICRIGPYIMSRQRDKIFPAMRKAWSEITSPTKNKDGRGYKYSDIISYIDILRPILTKYELATFYPIGISDRETYIRMSQLVIHDSGQLMLFEAELGIERRRSKEGNFINSVSQDQGGAITYLERYLAKNFWFMGSEDDDAALQQVPQGYYTPVKHRKYPPVQQDRKAAPQIVTPPAPVVLIPDAVEQVKHLYAVDEDHGPQIQKWLEAKNMAIDDVTAQQASLMLQKLNKGAA